jgi:diguanylate cyclase (GGDEF)-like protein
MGLRSGTRLEEPIGGASSLAMMGSDRIDIVGRNAGVPPADFTNLRHARREIEALRARNAYLTLQIEELQRREAHARRLAARDELTGLYNRRLMLEGLAGAMTEARAGGSRLGVLFIDLNGFKAVNDHFGHSVGDALLVAVGARIAARARRNDIICRYGGDEFVVVLPGLPDDGIASQIAEALSAHLAAPYFLGGVEIHVTASIGLAVCPRDGSDAEALLQRADASMYRRKVKEPPPIPASA